MPSTGRMILGFVLAPLATPVTLSVLVVAFYAVQWSLAEAGEALGLFALYGAVYAYYGLGLAVPGAIILRRKRRTSAAAHALLGSLVGGVPLALLAGLGGWHNAGGRVGAALLEGGIFAALGVVCGALSGLLFWALVYSRRSAA